MNRVEIGGGPAPFHPDWEQFDAIDWSQRTGLKYTTGDARKLPYEDGSLDHVYASNLLEHFGPDETAAILTEWARVLRIGGILELVVPDAMGILRDHFAGVNTWTECEERLRGSRDYPGNQHLAAFTRAEFPTVIAEVRSLELLTCESSHRGGGIHCITARVEES